VLRNLIASLFLIGLGTVIGTSAVYFVSNGSAQSSGPVIKLPADYAFDNNGNCDWYLSDPNHDCVAANSGDQGVIAYYVSKPLSEKLIPTYTSTAVPTDTSTPTPTNTSIPTPTNTSTPTNTPIPTATNTLTPANTPTPTSTRTNTPVPPPTATFTPITGGRDKLLWPFASDSPWNHPIGSGAVYQDANIFIDDGFAVENALTIMSPTSPLRSLRDVGHWWPISCTEGSDNGALQVPIPNTYVIGGAGTSGDGTLPNRPGGVLLQNGTTIQEFQYAVRCSGTGPLVAGAGDRCQHSIYGSGLCSFGAQGGSGLSGVGGVLRTWEINDSGPIRHALKVTISVEFLSNCNGGYRWPAVAADGYHNEAYAGSNCNLRMGSLVALPVSYNCGAQTNLAQRICQALKDYGAYVGDTHNGWNPFSIIGEVGTHTALNSFESSLIMYAEDLNVIANNASNNIGGGGTPRVPLAPPISN